MIQATDFRWFDGGVNITHSKLHDQLEDVLARAANVGVVELLAIACNLEDTRTLCQLAERYPQLRVTAGVHPHDAAAAPADLARQLLALAQQPAVVAIGECGLDFNRNYSPPEVQRQVFETQLQVAAELGLPVYLHERDAFTDQLAYLKRYRSSIPAMLAHCFTGSCEELEGYLQLDCYIGITGWVCDERRGGALREAVPMIPSDRLVLETDAPFLLPRTLRPRPSYNEPCWLPEIASVVAQLRDESLTNLSAATWRNSQRLFGCEGWRQN
ncbi:TatD family hydrolase [Pseudidiomarina sediminum]|uniref:TatD family hydrolase n=1 Tax=Pseudidiomarina sediminum TaxID=431675 RepID=UPI00040A9F7F|nr:TatD family hydrolase [Pseudidiomarina sediminum]